MEAGRSEPGQLMVGERVAFHLERCGAGAVPCAAHRGRCTT